ncbi:hypothetical protein G3I18_07125 [Actinospica acidiphila]|uniref:Secreted protein n=1 Tax=Actinospica acidiphila TaxID=304899 RepID=A0A9X5HAX1_9ACTN|nr:hypothetical protein [Actinospica acidiphila]NEC48349.1 hypothetical protein [Actinospica acidiphila]
MRKFQKAAVVVAMLGSVGFLGAGVSHAGEEPGVKLDNKQATSCSNGGDKEAGGLLPILNNVLNDNNIAVNVLGVQHASADVEQECNAAFGIGD